MPRPSDKAPPHCPGANRTSQEPNFMTYPYPESERIRGHLERLSGMKDESKRCIINLLEYRAVRTRARFPRGQSAAVLVPLFVGRSGDLYVLLSRRSDALKAFSGDTALPGGKVDAQDVTVEDTARREAFEEIGLPQDKERMPLLCVMEPHLAKGEMLVTPVVVLILDNSLQPNLNSSEVTSIFAQPLISFLSSKPYFSGNRTVDPNRPYHTFTDTPWSGGGTVRLHRFLTGREAEGVKPVFGLTASILIKTATIGYGQQPDFEFQPPNAPTPAQQIARAFLTPANPLRIACDREGVDANKTAAWLLRPPVATNAARTIEWKKIREGWRKLMDGDNAAQIGAVAGKGKGTDSGSCAASWDRNLGEEGLQEHIYVTKKRVVNGNGEGTKGLSAKTEEYEKQAREYTEKTEENRKKRSERTEERQEMIPTMAKLGEFLDKTQDTVNERMEEVKGDEKRLSKARKASVEQAKKQLEEVRNGDGEFGPKSLFAMISKDDQEGLKGSIEAGKEGSKRWKDSVGNGGVCGQDIENGKEGTRRDSKEMKKHISKDPEQTRKNRDAKL